MSPVEIIFILLGIAILVASCFVESREKQTDTAILLPEEALELQKQELKKYADGLLEETSEQVIVKTDDYLSRISNEKIMSVNDFSTQILEKIDTNHKEVVFLYDMLNKKEDEIKQTVQQFDQEKQEMQEVIGDVIRLTKQLKATIQKEEPPKAVIEKKKTEVKKNPVKSVKTKEKELVKTVENKTDGQMEFVEIAQADQQREEVLKLHKQGKTVLEISRIMGMGQGEVKLIIGLYGA